jgi:hypothetical protein
MQTAKDRTLGAEIAAPAVVDSERLSPGRDRRWHPRQVQRPTSCLRERKITLPTDLWGGALAIEEAAPFSGGQPGLAILAESSEPATITPRATRLTPMMKFLIIVVFYSRSFDAFLH